MVDLIRLFRRNRPAKLKIAAWNDDFRGPLPGPESITSTIDNLNFLKAMMVSGIIAVLLANMALAYGVMNRMNVLVYVADGSRFGCRLQTVNLQ